MRFFYNISIFCRILSVSLRNNLLMTKISVGTSISVKYPMQNKMKSTDSIADNLITSSTIYGEIGPC